MHGYSPLHYMSRSCHEVVQDQYMIAIGHDDFLWPSLLLPRICTELKM